MQMVGEAKAKLFPLIHSLIYCKHGRAHCGMPAVNAQEGYTS